MTKITVMTTMTTMTMTRTMMTTTRMAWEVEPEESDEESSNDKKVAEPGE